MAKTWFSPCFLMFFDVFSLAKRCFWGQQAAWRALLQSLQGRKVVLVGETHLK